MREVLCLYKDDLVPPVTSRPQAGKFKNQLKASLYTYNKALIRRGRHRQVSLLIIVGPAALLMLTTYAVRAHVCVCILKYIPLVEDSSRGKWLSKRRRDRDKKRKME